jgi:glycosyltransferase involved in cell wall biosynthesis
MKISIVTPSYPTEAEPYRGAPIWSTLRGLAHYANLKAYCTMPDYPFLYQPRTYMYSPPSGQLENFGFDSLGIRYPAIPWLTRTLNGRLIYRRLRALVEADVPDLLLTYWVYPDGYATVLLGRELGIPVIVGSRGSDLRLLPAKAGMRQKVLITLANASAVLCVSTDLGNIAERLGASSEKIHVIRNGVDASVFRYCDQGEARGRLGFPMGKPLALYAGRLVPLKGLDKLVEAAAIMTWRTGTDWILALAGVGFLESSLRRQAHELGIERQLLFLGAIEPAQVAEWMNAADLLCLPSESEGCPNVVLESLSCGRPVVSTAVGGVPEILGKDCGVLTAADDPRTLAEALDTAYRTPWDRPVIASRRQRGWDQVARETYQVCEDVWTIHGRHN